MNQLFTKLNYWKMAWIVGGLHVIVGLGTVWKGATDNIKAEEWHNMATWDRSKIYVLLIISCANNVKSFLDDSIRNLKAGNGNGHTGDTAIITKTSSLLIGVGILGWLLLA